MIKLTLQGHAIAPSLKHATDIGLDLYAPFRVDLAYMRPQVIRTGVMVEWCPPELWLQICMKSGIDDWFIMGGVIDSGYRGELGVKVIAPSVTTIRAGAKIAQLVIREHYAHIAYTEIDGSMCEASETSPRMDSGGLWGES